MFRYDNYMFELFENAIVNSNLIDFVYDYMACYDYVYWILCPSEFIARYDIDTDFLYQFMRDTVDKDSAKTDFKTCLNRIQDSTTWAACFDYVTLAFHEYGNAIETVEDLNYYIMLSFTEIDFFFDVLVSIFEDYTETAKEYMKAKDPSNIVKQLVDKEIEKLSFMTGVTRSKENLYNNVITSCFTDSRLSEITLDNFKTLVDNALNSVELEIENEVEGGR